MYMPNGKRRIRLEPIRAMWQKHLASKDHRAVMKAADLAAARHVSPMIFTTIDQVTRVLECALAARQALTLGTDETVANVALGRSCRRAGIERFTTRAFRQALAARAGKVAAPGSIH